MNKSWAAVGSFSIISGVIAPRGQREYLRLCSAFHTHQQFLLSLRSQRADGQLQSAHRQGVGGDRNAEAFIETHLGLWLQCCTTVKCTGPAGVQWNQVHLHTPEHEQKNIHNMRFLLLDRSNNTKCYWLSVRVHTQKGLNMLLAINTWSFTTVAQTQCAIKLWYFKGEIYFQFGLSWRNTHHCRTISTLIMSSCCHDISEFL